MNRLFPLVIFEGNASLQGDGETKFRGIEASPLENDRAHFDFSPIISDTTLNIEVGYASRLRAIYLNMEFREVHFSYIGSDPVLVKCCKCNGFYVYAGDCQCLVK